MTSFYVDAGDLNTGPNARQALDQLRLTPAEPWRTPGEGSSTPYNSRGRVGGTQCGNWAGLSMLLSGHLN